MQISLEQQTNSGARIARAYDSGELSEHYVTTVWASYASPCKIK